MAKPGNRLVLGALLGVAVGMVGLSYAAVPLYRVFCQATGFGGTTQRSATAADHTVDRTIEIRFDTTVNKDLPWSFHPNQRSVTLKVGETGMATFHAENLSGQTIGGSATYNVTPDKAGLYFVKMQCCCFNPQVLRGHEAADLPVAFYVDPEIMKDRNLEDVTVITLSYTFFKSQDQKVDATVETPLRSAAGETAAKTPKTVTFAPAALAADRQVE